MGGPASPDRGYFPKFLSQGSIFSVPPCKPLVAINIGLGSYENQVLNEIQIVFIITIKLFYSLGFLE